MAPQIRRLRQQYEDCHEERDRLAARVAGDGKTTARSVAKLALGERALGQVVHELNAGGDSPARRWLDAQAARPEADCGRVASSGATLPNSEL